MKKLNWDKFLYQVGFCRYGYLVADGVPITFREVRLGNKIYCIIYICSQFKGFWIDKNHPLNKYCYSSEKCFYTRKEQQKWYSTWKKIEGKKAADARKKKWFYTVYSPFFPSLNSFKKHIVKVSDEIKLLEYDEYIILKNEFYSNNKNLFELESKD